MWSLIILCAIAQAAHCSCPSGFDLIGINGMCGGSYVNLTLTPENALETALAKCNEMRAQPVIIHNDQEQLYWRSRAGIAPSVSPLLLLGLTCNSTTSKFEWVDGSPLDYKPYIVEMYETWYDSPCVSGVRFYLTSDGRWFQWNGTEVVGEHKVDISCTIPLHPSTFTGCDTLEDEDGDIACYRFFESPESWQDAEKTCKKIGANLASIHNLQENSFLHRLAVSRGAVSGLYLGATIPGSTDFGNWSDGSEQNYDNFAAGFPKNGYGECLAMDTSTSAGQWVNIACKEKLPFACVRFRKSEHTCSSETWKEGTVITSPGFPYSASTPCDYSLMVAANKRVELEIIHLEANSCCDYLTIYDGYLGKVLANITGDVSHQIFTTTSENIMKVSWQPKGGVGVTGMSMAFRGV